MTRLPSPALYLGNVTTGSGVSIHSPEGQERYARALSTIEIRDHIPAPSEQGRAAVQHALSILRSTNPSNTSGKTG